MRIFLSYASEDRELVEPIVLALRAQGHVVFFDRDDLPPAEEFDGRIRKAIENCHLVVFMVSPASLQTGSYTLTELAIAEKSWEHPGGKLLPVILQPIAFDRIPPFLKSVTVLEPEGNVAASVADAVHRIATARRWRLLKTAATGLAIAGIVGASVFVYRMYWQTASGTTAKDGAPAVAIPAGTMMFGDGEYSPLREIYVSDFFIDQYEVTVSRYVRFLKTTGGIGVLEGKKEADLASVADLPVVGVDWRDADAYCRWAGKRLPTEAEWEKAARGTDGRPYPWENDEPTSGRANFANSAQSPYNGGLAPVGGRAGDKSPYGVRDLAGNASEWTADWFAESFAPGDVRNPKGPESGTAKVIRGGGWHDPPDRLRSSRRWHASPDTRKDDLGFRCAKDFQQ